MLDTMKGLASIVQDFPPSVRVVVWLNEYFGPIVNASGKPFEELPAYIDNKDRIFALVRLSALSEEATSDLRDMLSRRLTFTQALAPREHRHPARSEVAAVQDQAGRLAADRTGGVMDPRKLREALRKQGIFVHESDPILDMAAICDVTWPTR